jgi:ribosomal protein L29
LRLQMVTCRLENNMHIRKTKRDIARVKTVMRQLRDTQQQGSTPKA